MFGLRNFTEAQPRSKNGQPHQRHHWSGQRELDPVAEPRTNGMHGEPESARASATWRRQRVESRDHAASRSGASCRAVRDSLLRGGDGHGLQGHAADRTRARGHRGDLGMHGAGPLRLGGAAEVRGSSAMPHLGQAPGRVLADLGIHGADIGGKWACSQRNRMRLGFASRSKKLLGQVPQELFLCGFELLATAA